MKKFIVFLLCFALAFSLAACGHDKDNDATDEEQDVIDPADTPADGPTDEPTDAPTDDEQETPSSPVNPDPGSTGEDVPPVQIPEADEELVEKFGAYMDKHTGEMLTETYSLFDTSRFNNWFPGNNYVDGSYVIANTPMMGRIAHVAVLMILPDGTDAEAYAKLLEEKADPRWETGVEADAVFSVVHDNMVLFVMTISEAVDTEAMAADTSWYE